MTKDNWTSWSRDSHFKLGTPSVTISKDGITLNASLNKLIDVTKFINMKIELNHVEKDLATKVKCVLNIEEEANNNFKITRARTNEDKRRGFVACRNLILSQTKLKRISQNKRSGRRIEVKAFGTNANAFTFDLDPCFENSVTDTTALPGKGGVYRYWDKAEIVYIGRGKNIKSRSKDIHRNSWVYDKIEYSLIDDEHDQSFWESKFISAFKTEFGRLPRYNEVAGASIIKLENGRNNESII